MANGFIQPGREKDYINTTDADIKSGDTVVFSQSIAIANTDIPIGTAGTLATAGVWRRPKQKGITLNQGDPAFYAEGLIVAEGDTPAGEVWTTSMPENETVDIKIG